MRVVVAGLGVQGRKRVAVAGDDVVAVVDPVADGATHRAIEDVPLDTYDAAILSVPDDAKPALVTRLLEAGKHVLVEKPLAAPAACDAEGLARLAQQHGVALYTAYNHRFEPHIVRLHELLREGTLGTPYRISIFYGNGTARDVRSSPWRDAGLGVVTDLAPHLLDLCLFLTGTPDPPLRVLSCRSHENAAPDHFLIGYPEASPAVTLEGTLLSWCNTFRLDVIGSEGSAHIDGLCKWGPSTLTVRRRVLPSGKPPEETSTLEQADPTWEAEYAHFARLCTSRAVDVTADAWIDGELRGLAASIAQAVP